LRELTLGWSAKRQLLGKAVFNDKSERIGVIDEIIIAPDKAVSYAIIGAGVCGIGRPGLLVEAYHGGSWAWMLMSGIADPVLATIIILGWPTTAAWALGLIVRINLIASGRAIVIAGFAGRSLGKAIQHTPGTETG